MTPLRLPRGLFGILACLGAGPFLGAATQYTPYHFKVIAGIPGVIGSADGIGSAATFYTPAAVALDSQGDLYVADSNNNTIRKLTPSTANGVTTWTVSTLAGQVQVDGVVNGPGAAAEFYDPIGLYINYTGMIEVYDQTDQPVLAYGDSLPVFLRQVTPQGVVTTLFQYDVLDPIGVVQMRLKFLASRTYALDSAITNNQYWINQSSEVSEYDSLFTGFTLLAQQADTLIGPIAGAQNIPGSADGPPSAATVNQPEGVAVDLQDNVYIADTGNSLIRKATRSVTGGLESWYVTTLGGVAGSAGSADGTGAAARFNAPYGITVGPDGTVYFADANNNTIVMGVPNHAPVASNSSAAAIAGQPVTLALRATDADGDPLTYTVTSTSNGTATSSGSFATFTPAVPGTAILTFTASDGYASSGTGTVTLTVSPANPAFTASPASTTASLGRSVALNAQAAGYPAPTYQWTLNGSTTIPGAVSTTDPVLLINGAISADAGAYVCTATNASGTASTTAASLSLVTGASSGYISNLSARGLVASGAGNALVGGFVVSGTGSKQLLVRGIGPGLTTFAGLSNTLSDPLLTLYNSSHAQLGQNDNWGGGSALAAAESAVGAFPVPANSLDAMLHVTLPAGAYTASVTGAGETTGTALFEIYDADPPPPATRLSNVSARGPVDSNDLVIGGFVIGGSTVETVLIRAVGPGLAAFFDLTGTLSQPSLSIFNSGQQLVATNTIWGGDPVLTQASNNVGAFPIPSDSQDCVLLLSLPPGAYTAELSGMAGAAGIAQIEIYEVF